MIYVDKMLNNRKDREPTVTFFTYADEKYYHFVLPFIFSVLKNTDAKAEISLINKKKFFNVYGKKLANLKILFPTVNSKITFTEQLSTAVIPNTMRFITAPMQGSDYTYITDVDMIIDSNKYQKALKNNLEGMKRNKTCFFNFVREKQEKLSGIHFVKTKEYYPKLIQFLKLFKKTHKDDFVKDINGMGDEGFLYNFVKGTFGDLLATILAQIAVKNTLI